MPQFSLIVGRIETLTVDAIVNAANADLAPGAGVDGAIRRAAGPALDQALAAIGGLAVGEAIVTPGFAASARLIVHTVAPIWFAPGPAEEKDRLLARCYAQSIAAALRAGAASLAFPALGTGFFGWPKPRAAAIATAAARTAAGSAIAITFCCFTEEDRLIYAPLVSG